MSPGDAFFDGVIAREIDKQEKQMKPKQKPCYDVSAFEYKIKQLEEEIEARIESYELLDKVCQQRSDDLAELSEQNQALIKVLKIFIEREKLASNWGGGCLKDGPVHTEDTSPEGEPNVMKLR